MALANLTERNAVVSAMEEYDRLGRIGFLSKYGFGQARSYFLVHEGGTYDSKAIVGAAHGFQFPGQGPLGPTDFSGGEATVVRKLRALGFAVREGRTRFWWVNQGQTFAQEGTGGYLWAPKRNKAGRRTPYYDNMTQIEPGDRVYSYVKGRFVAIGAATSKAYSSARPDEFGERAEWDLEGWRV